MPCVCFCAGLARPINLPPFRDAAETKQTKKGTELKESAELRKRACSASLLLPPVVFGKLDQIDSVKDVPVPSHTINPDSFVPVSLYQASKYRASVSADQLQF